jgi:hypothetical protein
MPLPKIEHPINEVYLQSLNRKVKYRPYLVKEEKLLLIAKESGDSQEVKNCINQILQNCCLEEIDISDMPIFDVLMFFVHLRAKSVGESLKLVYNCQNIVDEQPCGGETNYSIDLNKIHYVIPEGHNNNIRLSEDVGIVMKYPTMGLLPNNFDIDDASTLMTTVANHVLYIYDKDSIYKREEISQDEMLAFLDDLSIDQLEAIKSFFDSTPSVALEDNVVCKKCKFEHKIYLEDLEAFFI